MAGDVPAVLVSHGVQCAEVLAREHPDDLELQIAGLLHDIGLLLVPGDELGHPHHGAAYARGLFGDRVAGIITLHVDAQRYLEATVPGYRVEPPPTAAFATQPEPMTPADIERFLAEPLSEAALSLRHADDAAGDDQRRETGFATWAGRMADLAARRAS
jgi:predicted HD phosphohydrolase